jgi:hypothetical protein
MKTTTFLMGTLLIANGLLAQEPKTYKTKFSGSGKSIVLNIDSKKIEIEGYNGDEVIIEAASIPEIPKDADGLRPLSSVGVENTNMGLSANVNGNTLNIVSVMKGKTIYKMRVPKELAITIKKRNSCSCNENGMVISKMEGPLEINTNYEDITLLDVTGPIVANSHQGKLKVVFAEKMPDKPSSLISYGSHVDVTISEKAKVLFSISSSEGNMFTDLDLKPYTPPAKDENEKREVKERTLTGVLSKAVSPGQSINTLNTRPATASVPSSSNSAASLPSVYYWNGSDWTSDVTGYGYTNSSLPSSNSWNDSDRNTPKYILNEPQTKITIFTTHGNVYLRKIK